MKRWTGSGKKNLGMGSRMEKKEYYKNSSPIDSTLGYEERGLDLKPLISSLVSFACAYNDDYKMISDFGALSGKHVDGGIRIRSIIEEFCRFLCGLTSHCWTLRPVKLRCPAKQPPLSE
ncbi:hypothetical protein PoB_004188500 [Plakobranchus ocellatus]|uniref:Uncharacterized protein n=1 Tax=Plakobranchus ocellatus TaxID=259542 RepID=A0AAV4B761_9GAST|nr:hypothetical protein PoB_004188500 [Plakobranchus ocellatus]